MRLIFFIPNTQSYPDDIFEKIDRDLTQVPADFICNISHCFIKNPAFLRTCPQRKYEHSNLLEWININPKDPFTFKEVTSKDVIEDKETYSKIKEFIINFKRK